MDFSFFYNPSNTTTKSPQNPWQQEPDSSTLVPEPNSITRPLMVEPSSGERSNQMGHHIPSCTLILQQQLTTMSYAMTYIPLSFVICQEESFFSVSFQLQGVMSQILAMVFRLIRLSLIERVRLRSGQIQVNAGKPAFVARQPR